MENNNNFRVRPFLRCLNIPDLEWGLLKQLSANDNRSLSNCVRVLIKKEYSRNSRRGLKPTEA